LAAACCLEAANGLDARKRLRSSMMLTLMESASWTAWRQAAAKSLEDRGLLLMGAQTNSSVADGRGPPYRTSTELATDLSDGGLAFAPTPRLRNRMRIHCKQALWSPTRRNHDRCTAYSVRNALCIAALFMAWSHRCLRGQLPPTDLAQFGIGRHTWVTNINQPKVTVLTCSALATHGQ
jgi:hypothetical protein